MIVRILLSGVMAVGLCGFGALAWRATHLPPSPPSPPSSVAAMVPPAPPPVMVGVLIAAHNLRAGSILRPDDLARTLVAQATMAADAERDSPIARASLNGAMLRHSLSERQRIDTADVLVPGDHGFLAAILAPGMRAVAVGVNQMVCDAGLVSPGDHIDIILTEADEQAGEQLARTVSAETVLSDLRVLAIGRQLVQSASSDKEEAAGFSSITVEVSPADAERLTLALRLGKVALALRPAPAPGPAGGFIVASDDASHRSPPPALRAGDVMHTLNSVTDGHGAVSTVRVFDGDGAGKEFKF